MYTDKDPSHEDPNLVWRRDAIISIAEDKEVSLREMKYISHGSKNQNGSKICFKFRYKVG